jgi:hypothetical protein
MENNSPNELGPEKVKETNDPESARRLVMLQSLPPREPNESAEAWADRVMVWLKRRGGEPGGV